MKLLRILYNFASSLSSYKKIYISLVSFVIVFCFYKGLGDVGNFD